MNRRQCLHLLAGSAAATAAMPVLGTPVDADRMRADLWNRDRKHADLEFGKIAYCDAGEGPAALFIHGFPLNSFQWRRPIEILSLFYRCVAPDLMGLGFTRPATGQDLAPMSQARMLAELLDHLKIDRVHIIANDSGGAVAQLFAVQYPTRVRTMLLTNCDSEIECPPAALDPVIALAHEGRWAESWLLPWFKDRKLARSPEGLGGLCYANPSNLTDAAIDMFLGHLVAGPDRLALTDRYALALERNSLSGITEGLRQMRAPSRILWGTADPIFSVAGGRHIERNLGRSLGMREVPGAMLFWPEEHPEIIVEEARGLWTAFPD